LKALAVELNVPVVVLVQLNRESEKEKNRRPQLSDLRDTGALEQDADGVWFLWWETIKDESEKRRAEETQVFPVTVHVAKQRNGPVGDAQMLFFKEWTRFEDRGQAKSEQMKMELNKSKP
jgi:replicative DNA helicase